MVKARSPRPSRQVEDNAAVPAESTLPAQSQEAQMEAHAAAGEPHTAADAMTATEVAASEVISPATPLADLPVVGEALPQESTKPESTKPEPEASAKPKRSVDEGKAPKPQPRQGVSFFGFVGLAIVAALLALVLLVGAGFGVLRYGPPALQQQIFAKLGTDVFVTKTALREAMTAQTPNVLEARVAALEAQVKSLNDASHPETNETQSQTKSQARLTTVPSPTASSPSALEAANPPAQNSGQQELATRQELATLTQNHRALQNLILALDLRERVLTHRPFQETLAALEGSATEASSLAPLTPFAASGLPEPASLLHALGEMIAEAEKTALVQAAADKPAAEKTSPRNDAGQNAAQNSAQNSSGDVVSWLSQKAAGLVKIEPVAKPDAGQAKPTQTNPALSNPNSNNPSVAEQQSLMALRLALAKGDFTTAASLLQNLPARFLTAQGMKDLSARLNALAQAQKASADLLQQAYAKLAQTNAGAATGADVNIPAAPIKIE